MLALRCSRVIRRRCGTSTDPATDLSQSDLLSFWFGPEYFSDRGRLSQAPYLKGRTRFWYTGGPKVDAEARRFLPLLRRERSVKLSQASAEGTMARVILFDQISRNARRGTDEAFRQDDLAVESSEALIEDGFHEACSAAELLFLVMPLVHTETPPDGERGQEAIDILRGQMPRFDQDVSRHLFSAILTHDKHMQVLRRFGRYPHRNDVLGRSSTELETEWLNSSAVPGWARSQQRNS